MERQPKAPLSLKAALEKARGEFRVADPAALAGRAFAEYGALPDGRGEISLPYFGEWVMVEHPEGVVRLEAAEERGASAPVITQVLLLHYLLSARGEALAGRWVTYRELPQGATYERAFEDRAIKPLEVAFGYDRDGFVEAGGKAGGERARLGDASFYFRVLPRIPMMCILWIGDDEVPPGVNMVYDAAAGAYLPGEDLAYLGIALTARLLGAKHGGLVS